jgi:Tfp pilus assembly protein FimT
MISLTPKNDRIRSGFTSTELVVASSLLVALMSIMGPLAIRSARLWKDSRHQELALETLAGEIERLTAMNSDARTEAMESLTVSDLLSNAAPNATINAAIIQDEAGTRIELTLDWNQTDYPRAPLRLVGWLDPFPTEESL